MVSNVPTLMNGRLLLIHNSMQCLYTASIQECHAVNCVISIMICNNLYGVYTK